MFLLGQGQQNLYVVEPRVERGGLEEGKAAGKGREIRGVEQRGGSSLVAG